WSELQTRARLEATVAGIETERFRVTALESVWYMRNQLLRDTGWASMAHSLEVRTPLVDWTLLRTAAPLLAAHPGRGNREVAGTRGQPLGRAALNRAKTGFAVPVRDWMLDGREAPGAWRGLRGWAKHVYRTFTGEAP